MNGWFFTEGFRFEPIITKISNGEVMSSRELYEILKEPLQLPEGTINFSIEANLDRAVKVTAEYYPKSENKE